ncbi:TerC/Alx family metal homeostasis membrane protein [Puia dinghuensis]|uniref:Membrane protein n=1 Tax=Puia dinghuensis TaxID=1792502 RepID=A0A8J2UGF7_9BACT|nr:TerC/Alx family metal homeostasis membrane protein [Puia dinghuensis]GGB14369.1 membrane protein [Puia dinghuensis]
MSPLSITYLTFGIVLLLAIIFDLGLLSRRESTISIKKALFQTVFWVGLAMAFFGFLWYEDGHKTALEYFSAYLMEWSLSIDNIFVFILIFSFFRVKPMYYARVLLIGILMAIFLRIIFITVGIALVTRFHWVLYVFGAILIYTGITMFFAGGDEEMDVEDNAVYKFMKRLLPLTGSDGGGKMRVVIDGKRRFTTLFAVVVLLATTDIVFAVDSIPAVFGITQERIVIYTSNIFAVLGLRSLFFLLRGAVDQFSHLQQGIAVVLVFVGVKMLVEYFNIIIPVYVSLLVILICIAGGIAYSIWLTRQNKIKDGV